MMLLACRERSGKYGGAGGRELRRDVTLTRFSSTLAVNLHNPLALRLLGLFPMLRSIGERTKYNDSFREIEAELVLRLAKIPSEICNAGNRD